MQPDGNNADVMMQQQLYIYTARRHGATLAFMWSCILVHSMNISPILPLF